MMARRTLTNNNVGRAMAACLLGCIAVIGAVNVRGGQEKTSSPLSNSSSVEAAASEAQPPLNQQGVNSGKLLFFDGFEYEVKRDEVNPRPAFIQGKWSDVKSINSKGRGAGYLYTVGRIPGYAGKFPGRDSKRVLAIEGRSGTFKTQTDFYLKYGDPKGPPNQVPGDVWFQF